MSEVDPNKIAKGLSRAQREIMRRGGFSGDFTMATVRCLKRRGLFYHAPRPGSTCGPMLMTSLGEQVHAIVKEQIA